MLAAAVVAGMCAATTATEIYANDGTVQVSTSVLRDVCERVPAGTEMIEVVMGEVRDLFRPRRGSDWCDMLLSHTEHEFYNGTDWVVPGSPPSNVFGGSSVNRTLNNVLGDSRRYLSFWGGGNPGGCCSDLYSVGRSDVNYWRLPFTINAIVATPSPTTAPTPCANIHTDPTFIDALPAPICADMLARNECEIPAIRARCNFTCTGCTASPVIPPTRAPTSHNAAVPYAPGSATLAEIYANDGSVYVTVAVLQAVCNDGLPTDTTMIEVVMGEVHDFFRPTAGHTVCAMLLARDRHEFYNGTEWVVPGNYDTYVGRVGGSSDYWPVNNVLGDCREFLSFWGGGPVTPGGCCSELYSVGRSDGGNWRLPFTINAIVATPSPTASPTPCADVHTDPTFVDALPTPICADMLARNECNIPAIRAQCNFTCTGCTAAPVVPPTRAPASHNAAMPYAPGSATVTEVYSNDGTVSVPLSTMQAVCDESLPADATMIEVVMGEVHDFFRPVAGSTVCQMLRSRNLHEFYNGTDWVVPSRDDSRGHFGGSGSDWPWKNLANDARRFLSFWGDDLSSCPDCIGGCCSESYSVYMSNGSNWGRPFTINAIVATPSPTTAPTPGAGGTGAGDPDSDSGPHAFLNVVLAVALIGTVLSFIFRDRAKRHQRGQLPSGGLTSNPTFSTVEYPTAARRQGSTSAEQPRCGGGAGANSEQTAVPDAPSATYSVFLDTAAATVAAATAESVSYAAPSAAQPGLYDAAATSLAAKQMYEQPQGDDDGANAEPSYAQINDAVAGVPGHPSTEEDAAGYVTVGSIEMPNGSTPIYQEAVPIATNA